MAGKYRDQRRWGLTQRRHGPAVVLHTPSCHNRQHNGGQCSYSYPKHPPSPRPQEGFEHTLPAVIRSRDKVIRDLQSFLYIAENEI